MLIDNAGILEKLYFLFNGYSYKVEHVFLLFEHMNYHLYIKKDSFLLEELSLFEKNRQHTEYLIPEKLKVLQHSSFTNTNLTLKNQHGIIDFFLRNKPFESKSIEINVQMNEVIEKFINIHENKDNLQTISKKLHSKYKSENNIHTMYEQDICMLVGKNENTKGFREFSLMISICNELYFFTHLGILIKYDEDDYDFYWLGHFNSINDFPCYSLQLLSNHLDYIFISLDSALFYIFLKENYLDFIEYYEFYEQDFLLGLVELLNNNELINYLILNDSFLEKCQSKNIFTNYQNKHLIKGIIVSK